MDLFILILMNLFSRKKKYNMPLTTDHDKYIILKNQVQDLVAKWTEKAQTSCMTDDERAVYYTCAEELHSIQG